MLLSLRLGWPDRLHALNNLKIAPPSYLWCYKSHTHSRPSLPVTSSQCSIQAGLLFRLTSHFVVRVLCYYLCFPVSLKYFIIKIRLPCRSFCGTLWSPQRCSGHFPRTCEYVTLQGKRDLVDMIELRIWGSRDYLSGPAGIKASPVAQW